MIFENIFLQIQERSLVGGRFSPDERNAGQELYWMVWFNHVNIITKERFLNRVNVRIGLQTLHSTKPRMPISTGH